MKWVDLPSGRCQEDFQGGKVLETVPGENPEAGRSGLAGATTP